jgi:hypothetical protein
VGIPRGPVGESPAQAGDGCWFVDLRVPSLSSWALLSDLAAQQDLRNLQKVCHSLSRACRGCIIADLNHIGKDACVTEGSNGVARVFEDSLHKFGVLGQLLARKRNLLQVSHSHMENRDLEPTECLSFQSVDIGSGCSYRYEPRFLGLACLHGDVVVAASI